MKITIDTPYTDAVTAKAKSAGVTPTRWVNAAVSAAINGSDVFVRYDDNEPTDGVLDGGAP